MRRTTSSRNGFSPSLKPEGDPNDPPFLWRNGHAFQYCLFNLQNPTDPTAVKLYDTTRKDFQNVMDVGSSSGTGLQYRGKAVSSEDGLNCNMADVLSGPESLPKHLAESCYRSKGGKKIHPEGPVNGYIYSTHNIEVGEEEKVLVTFSESVNHFYGQLYRNLHMLDKISKSVARLLDEPQSSDSPLKLNSICLVKYTDNQWYRGLIVQRSPNLKVNFVDYGDTLAVLETDIRPLPPEASIARSFPVQAVPLGLYNVPAIVPQGVNKWFADLAVGSTFTISVMEKEKNGKLLVQLFDGSLNVNAMAEAKVTKIGQTKTTAMSSNTADQFSVSQKATVQNKNCSPPELPRTPVSKTNGQEADLNYDKCPTYAFTPQAAQVKAINTILENIDSGTETQNSHSNLEMTLLSSHSYPEQKAVYCMYKWPNISQNRTVDVYASSIAGPHYFWCQRANTEDLDKVIILAQEAAAEQDIISPEHLEPGSPCLALFSEDNQWYRAQVTGKADKTVHVIFVDYGNECDVETKYVRKLSKTLLEMAPQAFLCGLHGFVDSSGSWDEEVYDEFYNLIVDKPLKVTVVAMQSCSEIAVPQHTVIVECDNMVAHKVIQKKKSLPTELSVDVSAQTKTSIKYFESACNIQNLQAFKENAITYAYKRPELFRSEAKMVYASCIVEPNFFWCQFASAEDLSKVSRLAQEAGKGQQAMTFPQSFEAGSHCLALFPDDKLWYRALVVQKGDTTRHVLFVDYGNESDVDIQDIRPLPQSLLEMVPQAFLCRLIGFDESKGYWVDQAYDFFYNLLVDKPLKLMVFSVESHSDLPVPQYSVQIECEGVSINASMQQHWKLFTEECAVVTENLQSTDPKVVPLSQTSPQFQEE